MWCSLKSSAPVNTTICLPGSKSLSNRALILAHQLKLDFKQLKNLSEARDTSILIQALTELNREEQSVIDFRDAGTPARLFLAYAAALGKRLTLTGNDSLKNRSMLPLTQALESGGAQFRFLEQEGYFPLIVEKGLSHFPTKAIDRSMSSQYVSAIMLIAPLFSGDQNIHILGDNHSDEYLQMTQKVLADFGVSCDFCENSQSFTIYDASLKLPKSNTYIIEPDWSSAGYFLALACVHPSIEILIENLSPNSSQGDAQCLGYFQQLGLNFQATNDGILAISSAVNPVELQWNLNQMPDMAPTLIICAALKGFGGNIYGIENLKYKECNRIEALQHILSQIGYELLGENDQYFLRKTHLPMIEMPSIKTQGDHRMAMVGALLATQCPVEIDDVHCVEKSFPLFWEQWQKCNFELNSHGPK